MKHTNFHDIVDQSMERGPVPLEEQVAVLRGLGLEVPEPNADLDMDLGGGDYEMLLGTIGWGEFNFDTDFSVQRNGRSALRRPRCAICPTEPCEKGGPPCFHRTPIFCSAM